MIEKLKTFCVGVSGFLSIESLKPFRQFEPDITFAIQTIIGILTIIYLLRKLRKK